MKSQMCDIELQFLIREGCDMRMSYRIVCNMTSNFSIILYKETAHGDFFISHP